MFSVSTVATPQSELGELSEAGGGAICYDRADGYLIGTPPGWVNHAQTASQNGVCAMYTPQGARFETSRTVIYPQLRNFLSNTAGSEAIAAIVADTLKHFQAMPGGKNLTAHKLEEVTTKTGMVFEVWLFDKGPGVNQYEAVAYPAGQEAVFFLLLSTVKLELRDEYLPLFKELVEQVLPLKVNMQ